MIKKVFITGTHLLNNVSNNWAECGKPSTNRSKGISLTTAANPPAPSFEMTVDASLYCLPSANTKILRNTSLGLVGDALSLRIRSPHSRISLHRASRFECAPVREDDREGLLYRQCWTVDILTDFFFSFSRRGTSDSERVIIIGALSFDILSDFGLIKFSAMDFYQQRNNQSVNL